MLVAVASPAMHLGQYSSPKKVRELHAADSRRVLKQREPELRRVDKRLADIEADFHKNVDLLKRDLLNEEEFRRVNEARREERSHLEGRREELASSGRSGLTPGRRIRPTRPHQIVPQGFRIT